MVDVAQAGQALNEAAYKFRRRQAVKMVMQAARVRNDIDVQYWLAQANARFTEPYNRSLGSTFYIGLTAAGTSSGNQTLLDESSFGGNSLVMINRISVKILGKGSVVTLLSDAFGLAGQNITIAKPYGTTQIIPLEDALSMGFSAGTAAVGLDQNFNLRTYVTSIDDPIVVLQPKDAWSVKLTDATVNTVVAGHRFRVDLYGEQLRVGQ